MLRELVDPTARPLTVIFERSWTSGEVPEQWKEANVAPVFQKGKEKTQLVVKPAFYDETTAWRDERTAGDIVYLELSKAFKGSSHNILTGKLRKCGVGSEKMLH
ncbi:hypothetical protein HGM15179_013128 [Zosterops borbonicus]|uniref:Uncharacterized protein n=1 Tax=Zosterops borbonicus TaxID=364589 RepID=A0A8K1G8J5_9PASS|nr:hypothetical protein HGM15179_013128 [Zosterops borbonicus]